MTGAAISLDEVSKGRRVTGRLVARVVTPCTLSTATVDDAYALFAATYAGTNRARFATDLAEKQRVILLHDRETGALKGISTWAGDPLLFRRYRRRSSILGAEGAPDRRCAASPLAQAPAAEAAALLVPDLEGVSNLPDSRQRLPAIDPARRRARRPRVARHVGHGRR